MIVIQIIPKELIQSVVIIDFRNSKQKDNSIVEFRIPGYPGLSKELDMEVRLMRGKIFRGKIRMYFSVQLYVDRD